MKTIYRFLVLAIALATQAFGQNTFNSLAVKTNLTLAGGGVASSFDSIAALRASTPATNRLVATRGYWTAGDGGHGLYRWTNSLPSGVVTNTETWFAGTAGFWNRLQDWDESGPFDSLSATAPLYVFGDSQSFGVNAIATNYTSGGNLLPELRPFALVATNGLRALALTNYAIGGSRSSYIPNSATFVDRANVFNRIGRWLTPQWSGVATVMIGYNNFLYIDDRFDDFYRRSHTAQLARLWLTGWVNDGTTGTGVSYSSWATTGASESGSYADLNPFPRGAPGSDVSKWTVLDGAETISLTMTNQAKVALFYDTSLTGGVFDVYTNGSLVLRVNSQYSYVGASTYEDFPQALVWDGNPSGSVTLTITNVSGTNRIQAVGFLPATPPQSQRVIVGNITPRIKDGNTAPWTRERRMGYEAQLALTDWQEWPVWYADVFNRMDTNSHYQVGDESHTTPAGAAAIAAAFNNPVRVSEFSSAINSTLGVVGETASNGQQTFWVNAPNGSASQVQCRRVGLNRWSLNNSSATESGSDAGSLLELYSHTDAGAQNRLMMRAYRDQDIIQWPTLMELGDRSDSSTLVRITGATSSTRDLAFTTGSSSRWLWRVSGTESGSNNGANLTLLARDDSGNALATPIQFTRSTGSMLVSATSTFENGVNLQGSTVVGTEAGATLLAVRGQQGQTRDIAIQTGATNRWVIRVAGNSESGANAGSELQILSRADDGSALATPLNISRATGLITLGTAVEALGATTLRGTTTIGTNDTATSVAIRGGQNQVRDVSFQTGATNRWILRIAANTETGTSNAGSDLQILRRADNGTALDEPFIISRSTGNLTLGAGGSGIRRIRHGRVQLVAGTVTVSDASVGATSRIYVSGDADGGTPGWLRVSARSVGVSFTITSSSVTDTSSVSWMIVEP